MQHDQFAVCCMILFLSRSFLLKKYPWHAQNPTKKISFVLRLVVLVLDQTNMHFLAKFVASTNTREVWKNHHIYEQITVCYLMLYFKQQETWHGRQFAAEAVTLTTRKGIYSILLALNNSHFAIILTKITEIRQINTKRRYSAHIITTTIKQNWNNSI